MDDAPIIASEDGTEISTPYQRDVIAWAYEQARFLRAGRFDKLDIEHIADEIEDVAKSEQRELSSRLAALLSHMLKWRFQPDRRGRSWVGTIREQRKMIIRRLENTPSLRISFAEEEFLKGAWSDALSRTFIETDLGDLPEEPIWTRKQILSPDFLPD